MRPRTSGGMDSFHIVLRKTPLIESAPPAMTRPTRTNQRMDEAPKSAMPSPQRKAADDNCTTIPMHVVSPARSQRRDERAKRQSAVEQRQRVRLVKAHRHEGQHDDGKGEDHGQQVDDVRPHDVRAAPGVAHAIAHRLHHALGHVASLGRRVKSREQVERHARR